MLYPYENLDVGKRSERQSEAVNELRLREISDVMNDHRRGL
jgi:hypothetical protein